MGAWIEIKSYDLIPFKDHVAPLVGAWIEMYHLKSTASVCWVAPLVGAWIEIVIARWIKLIQ